MYSPKSLGFDRSLTTFSPDGRLYQVEYAKEAVQRDPPCIAVTCADGVVLAAVANTKPHSCLIAPTSLRRIYPVEDELAYVGVGVTTDVQALADHLRVQAQNARLTYGESPGPARMARFLGRVKQLHTQLAGYRPFGVASILAGRDGSGRYSTHLVDPAGASWEYQALAVGSRPEELTRLLEEHYRPQSTVDEGVVLVVEVLRTSLPDLRSHELEVCVVGGSEQTCHWISSGFAGEQGGWPGQGTT